MKTSIKKVIFPVAGLGTRFLPATKAVPKELLPVTDRPLIQFAVDEAREAGIEEFIFVTNAHNGPLLEKHFSDDDTLNTFLIERGKTAELQRVAETTVAPEHLHFCRQDEPLGLGHAVWCAREFVAREPFAVILPDDLVQARPGCLKQMVAVWEQMGGNVVAVEDVPRAMTARYGILDITDDDGHIASAKGLVEKPDPEDAPSTLSILGRYILDEAVFDYLDKQITGAGGKSSLPTPSPRPSITCRSTACAFMASASIVVPWPVSSTPTWRSRRNPWTSPPTSPSSSWLWRRTGAGALHAPWRRGPLP